MVVWQDVGQADRFSGSGVNGVMVAGGFFFGVVDRVRRGEKSWGEVGVEGGVECGVLDDEVVCRVITVFIPHL